jgi:hypothetical protein
LQAEYEEALAREPNPQVVRNAAKLLEETNQSSHWTNYFQAMTILRQARPKAGLPLLMMYMVKHATTANGAPAAYCSTFTILSGEDCGIHSDRGLESWPARDAQDHVAALLTDWWLPKLAAITTDQRAMTPDQLRRIVDALLPQGGYYYQFERLHPDRRPGPVDVGGLAEVLADGLGKKQISVSERRNWNPEDLSAALLPYMLERLGYIRPAAAPAGAVPDRPVASVPMDLVYQVLPMLIELRQNGQAADLDHVAADRGQPGMVRVMCILAVYGAGEKLDAPLLSTIADEEKQMEIRQLAILALGYGADQEGVVAKLTALLGDANQNLRLAATWALTNARSSAAVPGLKQIINAPDSDNRVYHALCALAGIRTKESAAALADFLAAAADSPVKRGNPRIALSAFESVTQCGLVSRFLDPSDEAKLEETRQAVLAWWKDHKDTFNGPILDPAQQERLRRLSPQTLSKLQNNIAARPSTPPTPAPAAAKPPTLGQLTTADIKALTAAGVKPEVITQEIDRSQSKFSPQDIALARSACPPVDPAVIKAMMRNPR